MFKPATDWFSVYKQPHIVWTGFNGCREAHNWSNWL